MPHPPDGSAQVPHGASARSGCAPGGPDGQADGPDIDELVAQARAGAPSAWDELVDRFNPLVMAVTRRNGLDHHDAADVGQTVWLRALQNLDRLHEPRALPGWLATTTRHECLRLRRKALRERPHDPTVSMMFDQAATDADVDIDLIALERREALIAAFGQLPRRQRELLLLFLEDPPPTYEDISRRLDMPIGAIGPTKARAMKKLRSRTELAQLLHHETQIGDSHHVNS
ncbi:MAG: RNA polymerase subunit sigma-24 [Micrococcales bacterium]|nr:MAG: RNA polymerase subunit sigma-24 [Micrococcales bacterium]PIE28114.1 MAG: RNA polymerase subunit sigma-24 [Micrococcales bacterium]